MDPGKWLQSRVITFMVIYWGAIILLTYSLEWVGRHQPAFGIAGLLVGSAVLAALVVRRRHRRYW